MNKKCTQGIQKIKHIFWALKPFWKHGKTYVIVTILCAAVLQPAQTYLTTLLPKAVIDAIVKSYSQEKILFIISFFAFLIAGISGIHKTLTAVYSRYTNGMIVHKIKNDINRKALYSDYKYYDNPDFYSQFAYAQEHFPEQASLISYILPMLFKDLVTIIAMSSIILSADKTLIFISLFFITISSILDVKTLKPNSDYSIKEIEIWQPFHYVMQILKQKENAAELRSSTAGESLLNVAETSFNNFKEEYTTFAKKITPFVFLQGVISPFQMIAILIYIVLFIIDGDINKIGLYASLTAATTILTGNLSSMFSNINLLLRSTSHIEQITNFFNAKSTIEPPSENKLFPPKDIFDIELKNVSFSYDNAAFSLKQINMHIKPGQRIAIVGENGAGKTTLIKLLLRLYDADSGEILINGINIKEYDIHRLRMKIGTAFQNERILAMTLRENLSLYHNVSDEKLLKVIQQIGLERIYENSKGLDTPISREFEEDGIVLSGGEAQRLAIARLFTGHFGLLLLDEPSSALDPFGEANLMKNILDISNHATTIMVAHRLSTVRDFDIIYYMENGKIIEFGTHDELVKLKGNYYRMFKTQGEKYQMIIS